MQMRNLSKTNAGILIYVLNPLPFVLVSRNGYIFHRFCQKKKRRNSTPNKKTNDHSLKDFFSYIYAEAIFVLLNFVKDFKRRAIVNLDNQ